MTKARQGWAGLLTLGALSLGGAGAQGNLSLSGTVYAVAGGDVKNTVVIACALVKGQCDETDAQLTQITASGPSAPFTIKGLNARPYTVIAWRDLNGNKTVDAGDQVAQIQRDGQVAGITPPAKGLELRLIVAGQPQSGGNSTGGKISPPQSGGTNPSAATCTKANPIPKNLAVQPGVIRGYVVNACGKAVPGARLTIRNAFAGMTDAPLKATPNADGLYSFTLPKTADVWQIWADQNITYDGDRYCLSYPPENGDPYNAKDGAVRNIVARLSGERPDSEAGFRRYYGGGLILFTERLFGADPRLTPDSVVTFTFQPLLPLVDGSQGQTLNLKARLSERDSAPAFKSIPLGKYQISATIQFAGDPTPYRLYVRLENGRGGPYTDAVQAKFSDSGSGQGDIPCLMTPNLKLGLALQPLPY